MPPLSSETDRIRTVYDELAPDWDRREGFAERFLIGDALRGALAGCLRGDVLELGSGTGATLQRLDWENGRVTSFTATDLSAGMLAQARQRPEVDGRPVAFEEVEATTLPYPDDSFDTVTTSLTLCTVPDPERTLREMSRVTRPGGRIVILEHVRAPNPLLAGMQRILTPLQERHMGCHLDRPTDELVREMGFSIERHERRFFSVFRLMVFAPLSAPTGGDATT